MTVPADAGEELAPDSRAVRRQAARLRIVATLILVVGVAGAGVLYWIKTRDAAPTLEDLMPGSTAARERQVGIMLGTLGVNLLEGWAYLQRPGSEAILIIAVAVVVALGCFRIAWVLEQDHFGP
jgi:hypothetical protein